MNFSYLKNWRFWVAYLFFYMLTALLTAKSRANSGIQTIMVLFVFLVLNLFVQLLIRTEGMEGSADSRLREYVKKRMLAKSNKHERVAEELLPTEESQIENDAIFCPSCAARIADSATKGQQFRCPVCGTQFEMGSSESATPHPVSPPAGGEEKYFKISLPQQEQEFKRSPLPQQGERPGEGSQFSTEQILLDRLTKEPPLKKQTPWNVIALVLAGIIGVSILIVTQTKKPDTYAPGQEVDSTVLLQKQLFFQHIVDSLQERLATNPQDLDLHLSLADAYYDAHQWSKSRNEFVTYLSVHPTDANARVDYAYAIAQAGDLNAAISEIDTALMYQPNHLNALVNAGILTAQTINDSNHVAALARARSYFERAKAIAEKTDPRVAARIDTLLIEINNTGERMTK